MASHEAIYHRTTNYTQMRNIRIGFGVLVAATMLLLTACENEQDIDSVEETLNYDCENLEADFGDVCVFTTDSGNTVIYGLVDTNCVCADSEEFFCDEVSNANPNYPSGYMGAQCYTADGEQGTISENCVCVSDSIAMGWDCPDLELDFGSSCMTPSNEQGFVDQNCDCIPLNNVWDCPGLQANVMDSCFSINGLPIGVISADCECITGGTDWDCPNFPGNVGDPCQNGWGVITADCDCVEDNVQWDCPDFYGDLPLSNVENKNVGDVCEIFGPGGWGDFVSMGVVSIDCDCVEDNVLWDCPGLQQNIADSCFTQNGMPFGVVSADCECE